MRVGFKYLILLFISGNVFSQDSLKFLAPSTSYNYKRNVSVTAGQLIGYGGSLVLLSKAWYKNYNHVHLHSFDDSQEWLQMDKGGHLLTAWYLGRIGGDMFDWSGLPKFKAIGLGASFALDYLIGIELLDGFSQGWGFSWSDVGADFLGCGIIISQKLLKGNSTALRAYKETSFKFSFHQTDLSSFRPALLGGNFTENILKDYNGQTYWISFNLSSFMNPKAKFPKWLNIAVGYGAEGMISGKPSYVYAYPNGNTIEFKRYRQYYLSLDIDLTRIKTKSHLLKTIFETISFIKIPAPSLEYNKYGIKFHPLYY
jgi:uncharacterized protein YfiM (DUF2279 family)